MKTKTSHSKKIINNNIYEKILTGSVSNYNDMVSKFVKEIVCSYYGVDSDRLDYKCRKREVVKCKQISMYLIHKNLNISLSQIGKQFQKNHATVIHSVRTITNYLEWDKDLKRELYELEKLVILKSNAILNNYSIDQNFYFIELNEFASIRLNKKQSIILVGYSDQEIADFCNKNSIVNDVKKHQNKNLYILEKNQDEENKD